jgi:hypothetical protein
MLTWTSTEPLNFECLISEHGGVHASCSPTLPSLLIDPEDCARLALDHRPLDCSVPQVKLAQRIMLYRALSKAKVTSTKL